jgi:hypothetical protein
MEGDEGVCPDTYFREISHAKTLTRAGDIASASADARTRQDSARSDSVTETATRELSSWSSDAPIFS